MAGYLNGIELLALGFVRDSSQGVEALVLRRDDPAVIWLGKTALEQARDSEVYREASACALELRLLHKSSVPLGCAGGLDTNC